MTTEEFKATSDGLTRTAAWAAGDLLALSRITCAPAQDTETGQWRVTGDLDTAAQLIAAAQCSFLDFKEEADEVLFLLGSMARAEEDAPRMLAEAERLRAENRRLRESEEALRLTVSDNVEQYTLMTRLALGYIRAHDELKALAWDALDDAQKESLRQYEPTPWAQESARRLMRGYMCVFPPQEAGSTASADTPATTPTETQTDPQRPAQQPDAPGHITGE